MTDSTIYLREYGDVTLPGELANSHLSLAEIGAVFCFKALVEQEVDVSPKRYDSDEVKVAMAKLKERGVIKTTLEGHELKVVIDFGSVQFEESPDGEEDA